MNCVACGRPIEPPGSIIPYDHPNYVFCSECGKYLYHCETCKHGFCHVENVLRGGECPIPAIIMVQQQEGSMIITKPCINPKLADIYCHDCICREDRRCVHFNDYTCDKYEMEDFDI